MKQDRIEDSINKYLAISEVYQVRDNVNQVTAIYQKVLKVAPMDVTVRARLIDLYIEQNNIDAALEQYKILADAYYQLAQVRKALEKYQEALRLAPQSTQPKTWQVEILYSMGDIYNQRVNWAKAIETFEQLVKLAPDNDRVLLQLVGLYFKLNEPQKAITILDRLMTIYVKQQKQAKILKILQDLIELHPQDLALNEKLATFYTQMGMTKQALEQYNKLGELQLEAGLRDDAARTIETIIRLGPDDPDGYRQLLSQIRGGI
jgi:tetratricopeptide (TPR) repeat protein